MNIRKTILRSAVAALLFFTRFAHAEEQTGVLTALSSTTLTGYVDTSASWWVGRASVASEVPGNDNLTNAEPVTVGQVLLHTNLPAATLEPFEPAKTNQQGSVWFRFVADKSGTLRISKTQLIQATEPAATSSTPALSEESIFYPWGGITLVEGGMVSSVDVGIGPVLFGNIWWANLTTYRQEGETQFTAFDFGDYLEFTVTTGEVIWVALETYRHVSGFPGASEDYSRLPASLYFDLTAPPANDSFSSNFSVAETSRGAFVGHLLGATREPNEPDLGPDYAGGSVWFHFKAATYGHITIGAPQSGAPVAIFTGTNVADLKLVAKTTSGPISFFGKEGETYHIAAYGSGGAGASFTLPYVGPKYRLYETTVDALFPTNFFPHFYGVRGATMLLYANTAEGWRCVEIEPIVNQSADLLIRPTSIDGQLRVLTIDENLPSPHVELRHARAMLVPDLVGIPGQTCAVSYSTDLTNWSTPQVHTLTQTQLSLPALSSAAPAHFFRITQSVPQPTTPQVGVGEQMAPNPGHPGDIPTPPIPSL